MYAFIFSLRYTHTYIHIYIYIYTLYAYACKTVHVCKFTPANNSSYWYSMYTYLQAYIQAHAYTLLQGNEPQPGSRRDSIDSQVSTAHSEQAQSLQRAGSKGLGSRRPSSRRRALGGGSSKTRSKYASSQDVALESAQLGCQVAYEAARHRASV